MGLLLHGSNDSQVCVPVKESKCSCVPGTRRWIDLVLIVVTNLSCRWVSVCFATVAVSAVLLTYVSAECNSLQG